MNYRRVGRSGLRVSEIALGSWLNSGGDADRETSRRCIRRAVELGINCFDTADAYAKGEAETVLGEALEPFERHQLVIATKAYWPISDGPNDRGLSRKHVIESVERSLRRLGTDYVDIFYCHRYDDQTPLDETLRAIDDLITQGKVLYGGVSEWQPVQIADALQLTQERGWHRPIVDQAHYNLLRPDIEDGVMQACAAAGLGIIAFSPLAQGVLTGKYRDGVAPAGSRGAVGATAGAVRSYLQPEQLRRVAAFAQVAQQAGCTPAQLALGWVLRRAEVSAALIGARTIAQLEENVQAAALSLGDDLRRQISAALL